MVPPSSASPTLLFSSFLVNGVLRGRQRGLAAAAGGGGRLGLLAAAASADVSTTAAPPASSAASLLLVLVSAAAGGGWCWSSKSSSSGGVIVDCEEAGEANKPRIAFLGSGSSTCCPRPLCAMLLNSNSADDPRQEGRREAAAADDADDDKLKELLRATYCRTSVHAMSGDNPRYNRDYRNNPSLLITTSQNKNIVIDVGKTFREGALRWFPPLDVRSIDAIVLTHEHMDAAAGLDDVRGFQHFAGGAAGIRKAVEEGRYPQPISVPLYASRRCLSELAHQFPWLIPKKYIVGSGSGNSEAESEYRQPQDGKPVVKRHVASFDVHVFESCEPFTVEGIRITPLPIMHGEDLISFGFAFTVGALNVVYLSDISRMLPETFEHIQKELPKPTHVLVVDALHPDKVHPVHFSMRQAIDLSKEMNAQRTYFVVSCRFS